MTRTEVRTMMVDEAVAVVRQIMAEDRNPKADAIVDACRRRFKHMNVSGAYAQFVAEGLDMEAARLRWRASVGRSIRWHVADLRPS